MPPACCRCLPCCVSVHVGKTCALSAAGCDVYSMPERLGRTPASGDAQKEPLTPEPTSYSHRLRVNTWPRVDCWRPLGSPAELPKHIECAASTARSTTHPFPPSLWRHTRAACGTVPSDRTVLDVQRLGASCRCQCVLDLQEIDVIALLLLALLKRCHAVVRIGRLRPGVEQHLAGVSPPRHNAHSALPLFVRALRFLPTCVTMARSPAALAVAGRRDDDLDISAFRSTATHGSRREGDGVACAPRCPPRRRSKSLALTLRFAVPADVKPVPLSPSHHRDYCRAARAGIALQCRLVPSTCSGWMRRIANRTGGREGGGGRVQR